MNYEISDNKFQIDAHITVRSGVHKEAGLLFVKYFFPKSRK